MAHVPGAANVTTPPAVTVHAVEVDENVTDSPDVALAAAAYVAPPTVGLAGIEDVNEIVCEPFTAVTACVADVAAK